jgi:hypothetical protein
MQKKHIHGWFLSSQRKGLYHFTSTSSDSEEKSAKRETLSAIPVFSI